MNKSLLTNLISFAIIIIGILSPLYKNLIMTVGFFAFSGSITNWLAVHMLFEKVPFLIGSGVIPNRFEAFKKAIKDLIMTQFFTEDKIKSTLGALIQTPQFNVDTITDSIDHDKVFNGFVQVVQASPFGGMLGMFGGIQALDPLKAPLKEKINLIVKELLSDSSALLPSLTQEGSSISDIQNKIIAIVDDRLAELTPQMIKEIIQTMIKQHLGWLVVWGGFFGGIIGLLMAILNKILG